MHINIRIKIPVNINTETDYRKEFSENTVKKSEAIVTENVRDAKYFSLAMPGFIASVFNY